MKRSELKTGMIVTTRDGDEWLVLKDMDFDYTHNCTDYKFGILVNLKRNLSWNGLQYYDEDLHYSPYDEKDDAYDIIKVERLDHPTNILKPNDFNNPNKRTLLWTEVKEVTMKEVEEKFGCKVKIIDVDKTE